MKQTFAFAGAPFFKRKKRRFEFCLPVDKLIGKRKNRRLKNRASVVFKISAAN